jgi:hypothetical protein
MIRLQDEGWPDSVAWKNVAALDDVAINTQRSMSDLLRAVEQGNGMQLADIVRQGAKSILQCVSPRSNEINLSKASDNFLELAMNIETLLSDLLLEEEETPDGLGPEEVLSSMLGNMNLAPRP